MSAALEYAQRPRVSAAHGGHYESWFLRANHPREPRAFWIRYTLFVPADDAAPRLGEMWAIYFDGTHPIAAQQDIAWKECRLASSGLDLQFGESTLKPGEAKGTARGSRHRLEWNLRYRGGVEPLLLLPASFYERGFPKAKALVDPPACAIHRRDRGGWRTHRYRELDRQREPQLGRTPYQFLCVGSGLRLRQ